MTYPNVEEPSELDYDDTDLTEFLRHELEDSIKMQFFHQKAYVTAQGL